MLAAPGVGLAAPQIGVGLRVFVFHWQENEELLHEGVAINPELEIIESVSLDEVPLDAEEESEGCLSFPGYRFPLRRASKVRLRALDEQLRPYEITAESWLARIFQHEFDHLEGKLYIDRLSSKFEKSVRRIKRDEGWGQPGVSWQPGVERLEDW